LSFFFCSVLFLGGIVARTLEKMAAEVTAAFLQVSSTTSLTPPLSPLPVLSAGVGTARPHSGAQGAPEQPGWDARTVHAAQPAGIR